MRSVVKLLTVLLGAFATVTLSFGMIFGSSAIVPADSLFAVLYFVLFLVIFAAALRDLTGKEAVLGCVVGLILSVCTVVGAEFVSTGTIDFHHTEKYWNIAGLTLVFAALFVILLRTIKKHSVVLFQGRVADLLKRCFPKKDSTLFFCLFILMLLCWIPAFLAVFPGYYSYDAPAQLIQGLYGLPIDARQPVVHTLLMSGCVGLGNYLFGSYEAGLAIYTILQALLVAASYAYLCVMLRRWRVPPVFIVLSFVFFTFNPIIQLFAFVTAKDVLFSSLFLLTVGFTVEYVKNPEQFFHSPLRMIRYALIVILMALFRKQGIYVFILALPFLIWVGRVHWKKITALCLSCVVVVLAFFGPVSNSLGIIPSQPNEMLSVPIQQIARVLELNPDSVTPQEKEMVYRYIPSEAIDGYIPEISDPVKDQFDNEAYKEDKADFFKVWLEIGLKNPGIYIDAFLYLSVGYFYPSVASVHPWSVVASRCGSEVALPIAQNSLCPRYLSYLENISENFMKTVPVASASVCEALPFWILVICAAVVFYQKKYKFLIPLLFIFVYWCSLIVGPVVAIRYAYPLLLCLPICVSLPFIDCEDREGI